MDAVTAINNHLDVEALLRHYDFDKVKSDGQIIRACCKLHGGNNPSAFVINKDTGYWYCHTGDCGGGDSFTLVERFEGFTEFKQTVRWLSNFFNVDISGLQIVTHTPKYQDELKRFISLVKRNKKKDFIPFAIPEPIKSVTKYRKFKPETLEHFNIGYIDEVKLLKRNGEEYYLYNRLVFPIYFKGIQVGISFRRIKEIDYPKWSHQPAHFETKDVLYNYDECKLSPVIVVVEGLSDVLAYYEIGVPAVATFGSHLTTEQYKLLLLTGADIVLSYDGDEVGKSATKNAVKMFKKQS